MAMMGLGFSEEEEEKSLDPSNSIRGRRRIVKEEVTAQYS